jgi:dolichol-phosphate mannosyltransferase
LGIGGAQLLMLGVIGYYIGYIFEEVKRRPVYVIRRILGSK